MDDQSRDRTRTIVEDIAARDPRVRLETAPPLPEGWCGKQNACAALAGAARFPLLLFVDADVLLTPDAIASSVAELDRSGAALISGVPRQQTVTLMEKLIIPLIHVVLLGYLPFPGMRLSRHPMFAAGCGQLVLARREAYERAGGHAAIGRSWHDGLALTRNVRLAGLRTDIFDATPVARCRMYRSAGEVWRGFAKNATEGMGSPGAILPWTALLLGGHVLPWLLLPAGSAIAAGAAGLGLATRALLALRFRQSWLGALLHPVGVTLIVAIQWQALWRKLRGRRPEWKGRLRYEA
jgi:hypothetical protein